MPPEPSTRGTIHILDIIVLYKLPLLPSSLILHH
jgi:hypothetical protein